MVDILSLQELIIDCGGARAVAHRFGCTYQNVYKMIQRGCLPDCDRRDKRRAEILTSMQKKGSLTPEEIRAIVKG